MERFDGLKSSQQALAHSHTGARPLKQGGLHPEADATTADACLAAQQLRHAGGGNAGPAEGTSNLSWPGHCDNAPSDNNSKGRDAHLAQSHDRHMAAWVMPVEGQLGVMAWGVEGLQAVLQDSSTALQQELMTAEARMEVYPTHYHVKPGCVGKSLLLLTCVWHASMQCATSAACGCHLNHNPGRNPQ